MTAQTWLTTFNILSFVGALLVVISSIGAWHFGNKIDDEKQSKIHELVEGKNKLLEQSTLYLEDLRAKEAEIVKLKSSVVDMKPELAILEAKTGESDSNTITFILGTTHPVVIRSVDAVLEFTSQVKSLSVIAFGSGLASKNVEESFSGKRVHILGGPLSASNYLEVRVETVEKAALYKHNLKLVTYGDDK